MAFVKLEPFFVKSLFEPVWITGRITVKNTEKILPVSDGKSRLCRLHDRKRGRRTIQE